MRQLQVRRIYARQLRPADGRCLSDANILSLVLPGFTVFPSFGCALFGRDFVVQLQLSYKGMMLSRTRIL
jgi:hypothetical protein